MWLLSTAKTQGHDRGQTRGRCGRCGCWFSGLGLTVCGSYFVVVIVVKPLAVVVLVVVIVVLMVVVVVVVVITSLDVARPSPIVDRTLVWGAGWPPKLFSTRGVINRRS